MRFCAFRVRSCLFVFLCCDTLSSLLMRCQCLHVTGSKCAPMLVYIQAPNVGIPGKNTAALKHFLVCQVTLH